MKYFSTLMMGLATVAALIFTSCGDDPVEPELNYEPYELSFDPATADNNSQGISFKANAWTLTSDQLWCQLRQGDKTSMSLTGEAGLQEVEVVVNTSAATDKEQHATVTINTNGKNYILANVTLGKITYRGTIIHNDHAMYSDESTESTDIDVFDKSGEMALSANFDYHIEMPEWCLVNGSNSFKGKAGEVYPVTFTFNEAAGVDKRYKQEGEFVFAGDVVRDVFTIAYFGMDKYKAEIDLPRGPKGEFLTPWGWNINPQAQTYSHTDSQNNTVVLNNGIPFNVMCRNDKVTFVQVNHVNGEFQFDLADKYATVTGENGNYTFCLKDTVFSFDSGELLAFSTEAWETIKANPACLLETGEDGVTSWRYEVNNNIVVEWKLEKENSSPFEMIVDTRTWTTFFEPTETHEYDSKFGCNGAWEITADLRTTNILIQPAESFGYETNWFAKGYIHAGFSPNAMVSTIDELEDMGFEPMNDQLHDKPALFLNLTRNYLDAAAAGPMFIAFRKDSKMLLLVIKAE